MAANEHLTLLLVEGRSAGPSGRSQRIREAARFSQADLAKLASVSPAAISRWEAGERIPREDEAVAYAKALRRLEELLEGVTA
jgi:transcriptional regulator with XRE-family HTH domain